MDLGDLGAAIRIAFIYFTILYLTGLGGLFSERSGIVNIGLEGLMVIGTVTGAAGAELFAGAAPDGLGWGTAGVILGLLFGALCGALFASVHAAATITFRVDHIVSGVVINLAAIGVARFLSFVFFEQATQSDPGGPHLPRIDIPLLSDLPFGLGRAFTSLSPVVIVAALMVFPVWFFLYRTRWGLRLRSAGENPEATRSLGVAVAPLRWQGVLLSGALAGLAGAFLSVEVVGNWREGQTLGLGFIALAALILSNWNPVRLMLATFLFGFAQAIPLRFRDAPIIEAIPEQLISTIPYVVTIIAIAGFVGRVRPPAAAGRAYEGAGGT
jgi:general nucleoside transport system permease protein